MAVIDGKTAFVGGINIGNEYAGFGDSLEKWRDLGMRIDGPAAANCASFSEATGRMKKERPLSSGQKKHCRLPKKGMQKC